jgi:hypothetical protein
MPPGAARVAGQAFGLLWPTAIKWENHLSEGNLLLGKAWHLAGLAALTQVRSRSRRRRRRRRCRRKRRRDSFRGIGFKRKPLPGKPLSAPLTNTPHRRGRRCPLLSGLPTLFLPMLLTLLSLLFWSLCRQGAWLLPPLLPLPGISLSPPFGQYSQPAPLRQTPLALRQTPLCSFLVCRRGASLLPPRPPTLPPLLLAPPESMPL